MYRMLHSAKHVLRVASFDPSRMLREMHAAERPRFAQSPTSITDERNTRALFAAVDRPYELIRFRRQIAKTGGLILATFGHTLATHHKDLNGGAGRSLAATERREAPVAIANAAAATAFRLARAKERNVHAHAVPK